MDRIYRDRIRVPRARYAVERDGQLHWLTRRHVRHLRPRRSRCRRARRTSFWRRCMPSIVVCIGLNYKDHAAEMNKKLPAEPLVFLKPPTTVIGPDDEIRLPAWAGRIEHEAEMAVVIGKRASQRQGRRCHGLRARRHLPQRRDRARAAGQGRAVFARQGLRHASRRSAPASRSGSIRRRSRSKAGSTPSAGTTRTPAS